MARLFFAIWPPPAMATALQRWATGVRGATGGRPIAAESIHLTLAFLGEIPDSREQAARLAGACVRWPAFELILDQAEQKLRSGIVWAKPRTVPAPLGELAAALSVELGHAGFALESRAFLAHVTLLRGARKRAGLPALPAHSWLVDAFTLVRSVLDSRAARYEIVARFPLGA